VAANTGRLMLASFTVSTSPQPVSASSQIVHSMSGVVRPQLLRKGFVREDAAAFR
jgi:hypothetical protein